MTEFKINKSAAADTYYRFDGFIRRMNLLGNEIYEVAAELRKDSQMNGTVVYINSVAAKAELLSKELRDLNNVLDEGLRLYSECEKKITEYI